MAQGGLPPKGRSATVVVASSTSRKRLNADLICDGVDDEETINLAFSYLPAAGGKVLLLEGQYNTAMPVFPVENAWLGGMGRGTIIKPVAKVQSSLTVDLADSDTQCTVESSTGFKVGMQCTIFDDDHCTPGTPGNGNCVRITSIDGNVLHFASYYSFPVVAMTVAKHARIFSSYNVIDCSHESTQNLDNITISDLAVDGNAANNTIGNYDEFQNGILAESNANLVIKHCTIHDVIMGCIMTSLLGPNGLGVYKSRIIGNYCYNNGYKEPFHAHGMIDSEIASNTFDSTGATSTANGAASCGHGIRLDIHDNYIYCGGNVATPNLFTGWWSDGVDTYGVSFSREHVYAPIGISIRTGSGSHFSIKDCKLYGLATYTAILCDAAGSDIDISGNRVVALTPNTKPAAEIYSANTHVNNNIFETYNGDPVIYFVGDGAIGCEARGNYVRREIGNSWQLIRDESLGGNLIESNILSCGVSLATPGMIYAPLSTVRNNVGYVARGEIRTVSGSIATLTENAYNSVDNPFGQAVRLIALDIYVSTAATSTSPNIDCGIGSGATTDYTNLFDDLPGETIGLYNSKIATPGAQTQPILWESGAGNRYLNMSIKDAAATGMVATYVATVMGL
jgi:hypothetical protein